LTICWFADNGQSLQIAFLDWLIWLAISAAISWCIGEAIKKKPKIKDVTPNEFEKPTYQEGTIYGVIFGMPARIKGGVLAWWGHTKIVAKYDYYTYNEWGNNKREYYIKGYRYYMGEQRNLCHGPIDGIKQIWCGERPAWPTRHSRTQLASDGKTSASIDYMNFFGGDDKGGGIRGTISFNYGYLTQSVDSYMASRIGSNISAYRGLVTVVFRRFYIGTSPYPRNWSFLLKRTDILDDGSPQWYSSKACIHEDKSYDLNAAHMLRECFTCPRWGLGYSESLFDDADWMPFADTLYSEKFGLSYNWDDPNETIENLIDEIKRHIDGTVYQDPETGKFVPKLLRDDYVIDNLETFDEDDIESVDDFVRPSYGEIPDKFYVRIVDVLNNTTITIPDEDPAVKSIQGGKSIEVSYDFLMITNTALGAKVAARERFKTTSMPATMTIKGKRTMSHLRPFDVFKLSYQINPQIRIESMVVRILEVDYGTLEDGYITFKCSQDVFAMKDAVYSTPPDSGWQDIENEPSASPYRLLIEAPFWELAKNMGVSVADGYDDDAGFLMVCASSPSVDSVDYNLMVRDGLTEEFILQDGKAPFTPTATIDDVLPKNAEDVVIQLSNFEFPEYIEVGSYAIIGNEIVKVKVIDYDEDNQTLSVTVARGGLDTVPESHSANDRIWFVGSTNYFVLNEYMATDQPGTKVLPWTSIGVLDEGSAPIDNANAFNSRANRPYPPGNFKINGVSYPKAFNGEPTLTWAHRDRLQQTNEITEHSEGNIGPEAGTTYTLKIYDENNNLARTETGLTGTSYIYTEANELLDCGAIQIRLRFVLNSVRDGYDSWQSYDITVPRTISPNPASAVSSGVDPTVVIS